MSSLNSQRKAHISESKMLRQLITKKSIGVVALTLGVMAAPMSASAGDDVSVSVSLDAASNYVFRGVSFSETSLQPGVEISKGGFTLGGWSALATGESSAAAIDEFDIYGGYGWSFNDLIDASVGFTLYHFPDTDGGLFDFGGASTFEINGGVALNTVLAPSLTAYYDFDLESFTLEGSVSHSFPVAEKASLDPGLTAALVRADTFTDYEYGLGSAAISYAVNDSSSVYAGVNYSLSSEDSLDFDVDPITGIGFTDSDDLFWFGVGLSTGF